MYLFRRDYHDPALFDRDLKRKLEENKPVAKEKMEQVSVCLFAYFFLDKYYEEIQMNISVGEMQ